MAELSTRKSYDSLQAAIAANDLQAIAAFLADAEPAEALHAVAQLSEADQSKVLKSLSIEDAAGLVEDLPESEAARLIERLSADSFTDEKSGQTFYTAELRVSPAEMETIRQSRASDVELKPGMPVEVMVPLRKRTALEYAFEPFADTMWRAFREH